MSIRPKYCELIRRGEKLVEVRKSIPKSTGSYFKSFIYCTNGDPMFSSPRTIYSFGSITNQTKQDLLNQTVIGEFLCNTVNISSFCFTEFDINNRSYIYDYYILGTGLSREDLINYSKSGILKYGSSVLYFLPISDLKMYEYPKCLEDFKLLKTGKPLRNPPQSWCYVTH